MADKNQKADNNFVVVVFIAGIFLLGTFVGNVIWNAVSLLRYDIAGFGDFYNAMGGWEAIARLIVSLVLIVYSLRQMKKPR